LTRTLEDDVFDSSQLSLDVVVLDTGQALLVAVKLVSGASSHSSHHSCVCASKAVVCPGAPLLRV